VPANVLVKVPAMSSVTRAIPKSVILTVLSSPTSTFAGLTSRCTTPASCAAASPAATSAPIRATSSGGNVPSPARLVDGRYSMIRYGCPPSCTTSKTVISCGCCNRAAIRPSRMVRRIISSLWDEVSSAGTSTCLTATLRRSRSS
jgi:hypothetical protein